MVDIVVRYVLARIQSGRQKVGVICTTSWHEADLNPSFVLGGMDAGKARCLILRFLAIRSLDWSGRNTLMRGLLGLFGFVTSGVVYG
jgi:hypothetical protein